jgi:hypothetical protein
VVNETLMAIERPGATERLAVRDYRTKTECLQSIIEHPGLMLLLSIDCW